MGKIQVLVVLLTLAGWRASANESVYPDNIRRDCLEWIKRIGDQSFPAPGYLESDNQILSFQVELLDARTKLAFLEITHVSQVTDPEQQRLMNGAEYLVKFEGRNEDGKTPTLFRLARKYSVRGRLLSFELFPSGSQKNSEYLIFQFDIDNFTKGSVVLDKASPLTSRFAIVMVKSLK